MATLWKYLENVSPNFEKSESITFFKGSRLSAHVSAHVGAHASVHEHEVVWSYVTWSVSPALFLTQNGSMPRSALVGRSHTTLKPSSAYLPRLKLLRDPRNEGQSVSF